MWQKDPRRLLTQRKFMLTNYDRLRSGAGPFDMVFAVGALTSPGGEAELAPILKGKTPPAVPVYFFEPGPSESLASKLEENTCKSSQVKRVQRTCHGCLWGI